MKKMLLLGDEAIAQGAIDAGISGVYAYPGTPSTEIMEYVQRTKSGKERKVHCTWSANEKTAMETALGMSYAGKRALVCMKHVGLNVAADPFMCSAITGANGGLVIASADDPSMHSSQNEQDSRFYGKFAMVPVLEPADQQESYDLMHYGYDLSEKYNVPVLMRITTRLAHSRSGVSVKVPKEQNSLSTPKDSIQYVLLPSNARKRYKTLLGLQFAFEEESENSGFNKYNDGKDKSLGIIVSGIAYNYLLENYDGGEIPFPFIKISQYPLPKKMITKLCDDCDEIMIIEEGYPLIEESLSGLLGRGVKVRGRFDGSIPRDGELNPNIVAQALGLEKKTTITSSDNIVGRPPSLCDGCPHADTYIAINEAMSEFSKGRNFSDIGCYTLGALPPYQSINTCVDMGASITMAKGAADAGLLPSISVIGDSTFTHSGITGLLDAVNDKSPITIFILDNYTTAMTGGQFSQANGKIENICRGIGVEEEHIRIIEPLKKNHSENVRIMKEEIAYQGVSVIIPRRECVVTLTQKSKEKKKAKQ